MVMKGLGGIFMEHGSCVPQGTEVVQTGFIKKNPLVW